jgi:hypothetical protein
MDRVDLLLRSAQKLADELVAMPSNAPIGFRADLKQRRQQSLQIGAGSGLKLQNQHPRSFPLKSV